MPDQSYLTSDVDFYSLLELGHDPSQKALDKAWRKSALRYHPDKQSNKDPSTNGKFHLCQVAYEILSDPVTKTLYDNVRNAKLQRKRQSALFEGRRKQWKDDLESREQGIKRPREEDEEEKLEREIRRLAEDGKRRRKEREEAVRRDLEQHPIWMDDDIQLSDSDNAAVKADGGPFTQSGVSELDRTVKVRWPLGSDGGSITTDHVRSLFSKFGAIESADLLNPKMQRLGKKQKKELAVICMIQYKSVVGAHAAVEDFPNQEDVEWSIFDSVFWAANKEPAFFNNQQSTREASISTPSTPKRPINHIADPTGSIKFSTPGASPRLSGEGLKKKPSFASFSPVVSDTPKGSPFGRGLGTNSPSLEEMTMIRLKNAEKRRLAAEIERQDAEEDATAGIIRPR